MARPTRQRSQPSSPPSERGARNERRRTLLLFFASSAGRFALLVMLVVGSGLLAGLALGLPLSLASRGNEDIPDLDHLMLAGSVDASDVLLVDEDLPQTWELANVDVTAFSVLTRSWCNRDVSLENFDNPVSIAFLDPVTDAYVVAEVAEATTTQTADSYIESVSGALTACQEYTPTDSDGTRVRIIDEGEIPPVTSYITRSIRVEGETLRQVVTYFQVGDVVVALQHLGQTDPNDPGLVDGIALSVLERVAPDTFASDEDDDITQLTDLPDEGTDPSEPTETSVVEGGAADEGEDPSATTLPTDDTIDPAEPAEG